MPLAAIDLGHLLDELSSLEWVLSNAATIEPEFWWKRGRAHVKRIKEILPPDLDLTANLDLDTVEKLANLIQEIELAHELDQNHGLLDVPACEPLQKRLRTMIRLVAVALAKTTPSGEPSGRPISPKLSVNPKGATAQRTAVDGMFSAPQLADKYNVSRNTLQQRLRRWRKQNGTGWVEVPSSDRGPRDPCFLYRLDAVKFILDDLRNDTRTSHDKVS